MPPAMCPFTDGCDLQIQHPVAAIESTALGKSRSGGRGRLPRKPGGGQRVQPRAPRRLRTHCDRSDLRLWMSDIKRLSQAIRGSELDRLGEIAMC
jgi:hypothetical protein